VSTRYRHHGFVLVRATTAPADLDVPSELDLSDPGAVSGDGRAWLTKVWSRPEVREAIRVASPVLAEHVDRLVDDRGVLAVKDLRRAVTSVASYLLRWQRRATPFGMFAGVGVAAIGPAAAEVGEAHRAVLRADAEWAMAVADRLEQHHGLRQRLTVMVDTARTIRGGRVIVHQRAALGATAPGAVRETSVRLTQPVRAALTEAASPIRFDELAATMAARFPSVAADKIHALLHGLVDAGVLITSLRAPMTAVDALPGLIGALRAAGAAEVDDLAGVLGDLDRIDSLLTLHNAATHTQAALIRKVLHTRMTALAPRPNLVVVDVRLDAHITVPERVVAEAERAASVLLRTGTQPFGSTAWMDYHARFLAHYGPGALVPVRELVADSGLGYPTGYLGAPRARPAWRALTDRDAALLSLIQRAALDGAAEIRLTDADVAALTVGDHRDIVAPDRVEIGVAVHAESAEAMDRGAFQLRLTAAPQTPTSMAGRFAYLLDDADRARLAATYTGTSTGQDPLVAQLSFPPRLPHNENVVRVAPLCPIVVSLSEHPDPTHHDSIGVDDLAVTADAAQMYLVQRSTGRRVAPHIPHALDTTVHSPPLARFLAEIATARSAVFRGFDLGAARTLPHVPRITYRRTILHPARWIITAADIAPTTTGSDTAGEALGEWQRRWRVPARVVLVHGELRLPINLDHELDRHLLRTRLRRVDRLELHEDSPPQAQGWIGRPAELLIPLTTPVERPLPTMSAPHAILRPGTSTLLRAHLAGNPARFDEILVEHLPDLIDRLHGSIEAWWIRRHRDMIHLEADQHLAVTLRLSNPIRHGHVAAIVAAFAADLETRGLPCHLTLASTSEHTPRYGDGPALSAAQRVFATDTAAAIAQLTAAQASGVPAQAWAAASMAHLAASFAPDIATGHRALLRCLRQEHGAQDRALRDQTLRLAVPDPHYRAVSALPGGGPVVAAWRERDDACAAYHRALTEQHREPATVLRTLLHEHHVRAVGVDPTIEKETGRLARAAATRALALLDAR